MNGTSSSYAPRYLPARLPRICVAIAASNPVEMVQKAATVGISFLAALSAPTAFAVRLAQQTGLTLVAFARRDKHVVYAHPHRLK